MVSGIEQLTRRRMSTLPLDGSGTSVPRIARIRRESVGRQHRLEHLDGSGGAPGFTIGTTTTAAITSPRSGSGMTDPWAAVLTVVIAFSLDQGDTFAPGS